MDEKPKLNLVPFEWDLTPVTKSPSLQAHTREKAPALMIEPSGRTVFNQAATRMVRNLVRTTEFAERPYAILPAVTADLSSLGFYLVNPGTEGSVLPKAIDRNRKLSLDLSAVLEQHPGMRSANRRETPLTSSVDKNSKPCLTAPMKGTPPWTRVRRSGTSSSGAAQAEQG